ncbi:MAG: PAS domain S-box protein, partial [Syntrophales bacterium]
MSKRRFLYSLLIILVLIVAGAGWFVTDRLGNKAWQEIIGESQASVLTLSIHVSDTLNHFEGTVQSLAGAVWIAPALMSMEDQDIERANSTLDRYNSAMNASVTYLMDVDGMTVASSNRKDADSFVGKSYRFRPYFQKAAQGRSSHYFALGITSGKMGFYTSCPVQNRLGKVLGVVTMKKDLDEMETFFSQYPFCFLISPDGIIILSDTPAMVLKSFWPLDKTTHEKLIASQQFGNKLSEAAFLKKEVADGTEVTLEGNDYLVSRKVIDSDGWSIALLTPTDRVWIYKLIGILATMGACSLIIFFSGIIYVTDRSQKAIRQSEESKRLLLHAAGEGIFGVDATGQMTFVNPAALRMLGFAEEEMLGQRVHALIHHSHKDGSNYSVEDCPIYTSYTKATKSHVTDDVLWRKDGSSFPTEYNNTPFVRDGRVMGAVVTFKDITARKQVEEALHRSETKFRTLYDSTSDAVMLLDKKGFFDCNKAALAIFGCATQEEFCMKHPADLSPPEQPGGADSMVLANQMIATAMEKGSIHFEWMHKRNDTGATFPADVLLTAMELDGKPVVQAVVRDITKRKRSEEKMEFFAAHDVLTGLLNRRSLEEMLNRTIAKAKRGTLSSLLYMDLDNFKDVNDTVGHAAGDDVLITLAGLFKDVVRAEDIIFRLGGDEFAVLLDGIDGRETIS